MEIKVGGEYMTIYGYSVKVFSKISENCFSVGALGCDPEIATKETFTYQIK